MEPIFEYSLEITKWLQANYAGLEPLMQLMSHLGRLEFFLAMIPLIYWVFSKPFGKQLFYILTVSNALVNFGKNSFRGPRPFWLDDTVTLSDEPTYGIPSGHTVAGTVLYLGIAYWVKKRWLWVVAIITLIIMGISRVYLGVHFLHDVIAGYILSALILGGWIAWIHYGEKRVANRILGQKLLLAVLVPAIIGSLYIVVRLIIGEPNLNVEWKGFIPLAEREGLDEISAAIAGLLGVGVGLNLEASRVRFRTAGSNLQKALRYLVGAVLMGIIFYGLKTAFPDGEEDPLTLVIGLRMVRYYITTMWITYYAPMFFVWTGLASADPNNGIQIGIRPQDLIQRLTGKKKET